MRNEASGDVLKVWIYAAAAIWGGAWISPLLYNAGKALAEVSSQKMTNGLVEWLAGWCRAGDFPDFYMAAVLLVALVLFLPWMEWVHAKRGEVSGTGPWKFRLPGGARTRSRGQALRHNLEGPWHCFSGFMLVAGLLLSMGVALVPAGFFTMRHASGELPGLAMRTLGVSLAMAFLTEVFFRGVAMGIFMRAMRPAMALAVSAAFFALVFSALPQRGVTVPDAEASGAGLELLRLLASRFADWRCVLGEFTPLLALGAVLAYARWRTASLWLPIGLHTGWLFAKGMLAQLSMATGMAETIPTLTGRMLQQGLVPLLAIVLAGVLAHHLTTRRHDEDAASS